MSIIEIQATDENNPSSVARMINIWITAYNMANKVSVSFGSSTKVFVITANRIDREIDFTSLIIKLREKGIAYEESKW